MAITGTVPPRVKEPVIWDIATDYNAVEKCFYAREDIDRKVFISDLQAIYGNPDTGELKTDWR